MAQVGALPQHQARIAAQAPGGLPVAHIDAIDALCAVLEQAIAEAPGGDAAIEADPAPHLQGEGGQGLQQLLPTPGDKSGRLLHVQLRLRQHFRAWLVEHPIAQAHPPGPDQLLGLLAAGGQAAGHQLLIQTLSAAHGTCAAVIKPQLKRNRFQASGRPGQTRPRMVPIFPMPQ